MADDKTPMRAPSGDIAPRLTEISASILFGELAPTQPDNEPND